MNRSVITQEIHVIKRVLGENVIDTILKEIKNTIKDVPKRKPETESLSLHMISDVLYDNEGMCRLIDFKQFGTIYIAKVFDKTSENPYVFLAYSIYDLIETFNNTESIVFSWHFEKSVL